MTKYAQAHDMDSWLRDPRIAARGFAHRWQSSVAAGNGEDAFIELVDQYLRPDSDLLDLGCGHGELTLHLAARCHSIVGIEREPGYLELAKELAVERKVANAQFCQVKLAGVNDEDRAFAGIPLADDSIDLFINRRGPILRRYLEETLRVARHGAVIVGLHPGGNGPIPPWFELLPEPYQKTFPGWALDRVMGWVVDPLHAAGISTYRLWWIDVPEFLQNPHDLYLRLSGPFAAEMPEFQNVEPQFTKIMEQYGTSAGIALRHQRLLWQVNLPK